MSKKLFKKTEYLYKRNIPNMKTKQKKTLRLGIPGIFMLESEGWAVSDVALIMAMVMIFILAVIILLKAYAIPLFGAIAVAGQIGLGIGKIFKSGSP